MAEQFVWTSADGATLIDLTDEAAGYTVNAAGTAGLRSVAYELVSTRYAGVDGAVVNAVNALPNQPTLGILVEADGEAALRTKIRGLVRAMRPKLGAGTLTVANELGESRSLACYCVDGLAGQEDPNSILPGSWWRVALKFFAPDPWWTGDPQTVSVGLGGGQNFFPIFPLALSPSVVQGQFTIDLSDSDAPSFPLWTITGPGSSLVLTNETTGQVISVDAPLLAGQQLVIDTRPGFQSVRLADGTNQMSFVSSDPSLWPLIPDVNVVTAALVSATSASRIAGTYSPRFAGI